MSEEPEVREGICSFCGRCRHETRMVVSVNGVRICAWCVEDARQILAPTAPKRNILKIGSRRGQTGSTAG